jgi:hypothetical protein
LFIKAAWTNVELISKPFNREQLARKVSQVLQAGSEKRHEMHHPTNIVDLGKMQSKRD